MKSSLATSPGLTVGLLGGSFDPPHEGHRHVTLWALRALRLDRVWWLVSPGNPLKRRSPADVARRMEAARAIARHPRVTVTDLEARLSTRYTVDSLAAIRRRFPGVRFVWLMGADNLSSFHHWERWDRILRTTPVAVFSRPRQQVRAGLSPAARSFARARRPAEAAAVLAREPAPCWTLLTGAMSDASSTSIRARGSWP